jgi:hypothetical protein
MAAWITRADLPAGVPGGEAEQDAAAALASEVLFGLSGRRWSGQGTRTITVFASRHAAADTFLGLLPGIGALALPVLCAGEVTNHTGCERPPAIRLPDYPVRAVTEVTVGGQVRDPRSYRLIGGRYLEDAWDGWAVCDTDRPLTVTYGYGTDPPDAGRALAVRLAVELAKAMDGQPSGLPGYITQRVRQGETISYTSAAALFDKGRTGLAEVDMWLATVNPGGLRRRSSVWSPDTDPRYTTTGGTTP